MLSEAKDVFFLLVSLCPNGMPESEL